jgi:hypothetical protein
VLPRGRNFGRKAQKGPKKIWRGRAGKVRGQTFTRFIKKGPKRGRTLLGLVLHKIIYISCQKLGLQTGLLNFFLTVLDHVPFKKLQNWPLLVNFMWGLNFFARNFLADLAENS